MEERETSQEVPEVSHVHIGVVMTEDGMGLTYSYDGMGLEAAIGHVTVVLDRMKEEAAARWATCPACGEPWEDHDVEDEEDD